MNKQLLINTEDNYYQTLEISQDATQIEVKQAYRRLVKQFHPDSQCETANHERIIAINAAYEVLGDSQRRQVYDSGLTSLYPSPRREQRTTEVQQQYQRHRQAQQEEEVYLNRWYRQIYRPINRLICRIVNPLGQKINDLAADPFDDELMADFQDYLEDCCADFNQARQIFSSQGNPAKLAKVAAYLYYCLNHISDGIEELELFTLNYDDRHLHTGKELFRMANSLRCEAQEVANIFVR